MKLHEYVLFEENKGIIGKAICEYGTFRRLRRKENMGIILIPKSILGRKHKKEFEEKYGFRS